MEQTEIVKVSDIIFEFGNDLTKFDLKGKDFSSCSYRNVKLPKSRSLFTNSKHKNLKNCVLSGIDFNDYEFSEINIEGSVIEDDCILKQDVNFFKNLKNSSISRVIIKNQNLTKYCFDDVDISGAKFIDGSLLPNDKSLFQKVKDKNLSNVFLPDLNYDMYNFQDVFMLGTNFTKTSSLPKIKDLFQQVKGKNINFSILPNMDYSNYTFDGVSMSFTKFGETSIIPKDYNLFKKVASIQGVVLGKEAECDVHLYDMGYVPYPLRLNGLTDIQRALVYKKYYNEIKDKKIKIIDES